ncbi:hypothetical protein E2562_010687 [Oryza meyeriana var. granulata]|uniref:Uncharacterized protein n=1 Tax=Oryza meyeriana var. granulata TaxID=110450 RepID=A0A6G1EW53_9ORYZ|nr:hypothetical protein E2562_010687 [Oryza meyeriana var. granulata]
MLPEGAPVTGSMSPKTSREGANNLLTPTKREKTVGNPNFNKKNPTRIVEIYKEEGSLIPFLPVADSEATRIEEEEGSERKERRFLSLLLGVFARA